MSTTLSKGYKQPDTGDRGSSWFADLNFNISRLNDHQHDGTDSSQIQLRYIVKTSQTISSASWSADAGGSTYTYSVTMPTGLTFDDAQIKFINVTGGSTGEEIFPTVTKTGASAFTVSVNDNTMTVKVVYG